MRSCWPTLLHKPCDYEVAIPLFKKQPGRARACLQTGGQVYQEWRSLKRVPLLL